MVGQNWPVGCSLPASGLENLVKGSQLGRFCCSIGCQGARTIKSVSVNPRAPREESLIISVLSHSVNKAPLFF